MRFLEVFGLRRFFFIIALLCREVNTTTARARRSLLQWLPSFCSLQSDCFTYTDRSSIAIKFGYEIAVPELHSLKRNTIYGLTIFWWGNFELPTIYCIIGMQASGPHLNLLIIKVIDGVLGILNLPHFNNLVNFLYILCTYVWMFYVGRYIVLYSFDYFLWTMIFFCRFIIVIELRKRNSETNRLI